MEENFFPLSTSHEKTHCKSQMVNSMCDHARNGEERRGALAMLGDELRMIAEPTLVTPHQGYPDYEQIQHSSPTSQVHRAQKQPRHNLDDDDASMSSERSEESAFNEPPESVF